jgi:hypothetical protein
VNDSGPAAFLAFHDTNPSRWYASTIAC